MQFQTRKRIVQTPRPGASPPPPAPPSSQLLRRLQQETLRRQRFLEARRAQTALEEERRRQTALRERRLHRLEQSRAIRARMTTPDRNRTIDRNPPESVVTAPVQLPSRRAPEPAIERMTSYARSSGDRFRMLAPVRVPPSVVGDHKSIRSEPVYFPHDDHDENEIMRTLDRLNQTLAALRLRRSINAESPPPPPPGTVNDDAPPADDDEHRQQQQEPLPGSSVMLPVIQARRQQWQPVPLKPQLARVPNARSRRARGR